MAKKTFTLYLAKPDISEFVDVFSDVAQERLRFPSTKVVDAPKFADGARLYIFINDPSTPAWVRDLRLTFKVPDGILGSSSCAVLVFRKSDRIFVAPFAHGWMYLNEANTEGDFGIRVAVNALDERKLKQLERSNLGDALRAVALSPFQREFTSFGLDDALDLVRKVSGKALEDSSADSLSGSRALKLSGEFDVDHLPQLADESLTFYKSEGYRNSSFKIIDVVCPIADTRLSKTLDEQAVEEIKKGSENFELSLPIIYSDESVLYRFIGAGLRGQYPDLMLRHYTEALGNSLAYLTKDDLKEHRIAASYADGRPDRKWAIRSSLVGSLTYEGAQYAINEGEWYRIDETFRQSIEQNFRDSIESWDRQPDPLKREYAAGDSKNGKIHCNFESEEIYNRRFAKEFGHILLDRKLIKIPGIERSEFEACDLLDINTKTFIHVKKSSRRSSILSHFFKQGSNSAQQFSRFPTAFDELVDLVSSTYGSDPAIRLIDAIDNKEMPWTVQFVIADTPRKDGNFDIPFFSKISLRDEMINLKAMRYRVSVRFINLMSEPSHLKFRQVR